METNTKKYIIIGLVSIAAIFAVYKIVFPKYRIPKGDKDPNADSVKGNDDFPLKKGSVGERVRKVRAVLGLAPINVFDAEVEAALIKRFKVSEITEANYNYIKNLPTITPSV
ncbi:MAG: hypothetical protein WCT77_11620 [Bacteroidota bacterium]